MRTVHLQSDKQSTKIYKIFAGFEKRYKFCSDTKTLVFFIQK